MSEANEICIVTTWKREELLWLCLEAIRRETPMPIYVFSDRGAGSPELEKAWRQFGAYCIIREPHERWGNSYNLLDACQWAVAVDAPMAPIIHLVEDDTIVHRGWFAWARSALSLKWQQPMQTWTPRYDAVCARIHGDPATMWYESPCASWNRDSLALALAEIPAGYLEATNRGEMQKLVDAHFSNSHYRYGSPEQDGFFLRCVEKLKLHTSFPAHCMATHIGFCGYNRPPGAPLPVGDTFEKRIEWCRKLLRSKEQRTELFGQRITDLEMKGQEMCGGWDD